MKSLIKIMVVTGFILSTSTIAISQTKQKKSNTKGWGGFYVGGNLGLNAANTSMVTSTQFAGGFGVNGAYFAQSSVNLVNGVGNKKAKPTGFTGGVQAGYNFQSGKFVAGIEVDFNSARQNKTVSGQGGYTNVTPSYPFQITQTIKTDWLITIRPRAGFAAGKAFFYGTGGLAVTNINYQMNFEDFPGAGFSKLTTSNTIKETKAGFTAGAGAEFKVSNKWSVKGEYLYTQFNTSGTSNNGSYSFVNSSGNPTGNPNLVPNQVFTSKVKLKSNFFRVGFNYRF